LSPPLSHASLDFWLTGLGSAWSGFEAFQLLPTNPVAK
jgi:hypothetical protein